ncbi:MAG: amino acid adenylation domain-containing protein, partial [bacterium]|nr:amino acid adenylation domain-containing protein [bacterium]
RALRVPAEVAQGLKTLGRRGGATASMTLLAAFKVLLHRYSGQPDVVVGTPIANRTHSEIEALIGFFVNTLVLRTDLAGGPSFRELLDRVRETSLGAYSHQDLPFEKLVEELHLERHLNRNPLCQVMFSYQNFPGSAAQVRGLTLSGLGESGQDTGTSKFDLTLSVDEVGEELLGALTYNSSLFDGATVQRMLGHLGSLLSGVVSDPERPISQILLLGAAERHQCLTEWNDTRVAYPPDVNVRELFEAWAARAPDAPALCCGDSWLSYGELDRRADRLAHSLRAHGVGPEVRVGILLPRSIELVTAMVGILKAGGAYLPVDPASPPERLAFILRDAGAPVLLTRERLREGLGELAARVVCVDGGELEGSDESPAPELRPENLAYVITTSGSTGRPKGVEIRQAGLSNLVDWYQRLNEISHVDRVTQIAGPAFDGSVKEFWPVLGAGASLHIPDAETRLSPAKLVGWLAGRAITVTYLPTPLAEAVLSEPWPESISVRALHCGGDRLTRRPGDRVPCTVFNLYGPTENTVVTTSGAVRPGEFGRPAIGRPIANHAVYLLDRRLRPVPLGVTGELYAAGDGLARGYLGDPQLTAGRFLPNPLSGDPFATAGGRLYKTGDLARHLPDGRIDFLGRVDHQVKIRGFRIELGEIEAVLGAHPAVREAAVIVAAAERLVAFVVAGGEAGELEADALRAYAAESLPDYMVPVVVVELPALPLTPNGKLDRVVLGRRSLPEEVADDFVAPRNPLEQELSELMGELLGIGPVSVHRDFFALGGHSLLAVQLVAGIRSRFGRELPLAALFQGATVERLAALIWEEPGATTFSPLVEIQRGGTRLPLYCVHPVGGNVLCYRDLARALGPDQPVYGLQARGLGPDETPQHRIEEMAATYLREVRAARPQGPYALLGWSLGGLVAYEMARQLQAEGETVAMLAILDVFARRPDDAPTLSEVEIMLAALASVVSVPAEELADLDPDERVAVVLRKAQAAGGLPAEFGMADARRYLRVYEGGHDAIGTYSPGPYPGRVVLFRATEEPASAAAD